MFWYRNGCSLLWRLGYKASFWIMPFYYPFVLGTKYDRLKEREEVTTQRLLPVLAPSTDSGQTLSGDEALVNSKCTILTQ